MHNDMNVILNKLILNRYTNPEFPFVRFTRHMAINKTNILNQAPKINIKSSLSRGLQHFNKV